MKYISKSLEETQSIAREFVKNLDPKKDRALVVGLYGELGSGKTSFTQGVAKSFEINETVVSPTFVIEKIYELSNKNFKHLVHIDAYRLEKSTELLHLGWKEVISNPENIILIEWPERVSDIMPAHISINFKHISQNEREIEIVGQ